MKKSDIVDFAKAQGYDNVRKLKDWNGYSVYEPYNLSYPDGLIIGFPPAILVKDGEIRMSTPEETYEITTGFKVEE